MQIFKSRYITIVENDGRIEIKHQPNYIQVFFLISVLLSMSYVFISVGEGIGLIFQLFFVYAFVLFLVIGLLRSKLRYPVTFTDTHIVYKKSGVNEVINYSDLEGVSLIPITQKKWRFEIVNGNKKIVEIFLFVGDQAHREGLITFKRLLKEKGVPIK